ncbi:hypothetical protein GF374_03070 [Candidatus Woesearchaeota archaeon]|nr:hypothetical protein [Candidatus Woesearchaeota archaeon]
MIKYLILIVLAALPISEARGAIIYGLGASIHPAVAFSLAVVINILMIPVLFWVLRQAHFRKLADKLFGKKMKQKIEKNKDVLNKYGILGLLIFIAIPLPVTGAWTGTFVAEILKLNRKKSFIVISIGVIIAALLVFFGFNGTMFLLGKII